MGAFLDREGMRDRVTEVPLGPLTPEESRELGATVLAAPQAELAGAIGADAGGNPFFIEELARYVDSGTHGENGAVPSLASILGDRIRRLPPPARSILEVVAVAGRALPKKTASRAAGVAAGEAAAMDHLVRERFVRVRTGASQTAQDDHVEPW